MRKGAWHQFGDRSQKLALEQINAGKGVGAIISPRDMAPPRAIEYAPRYRSLKAEVLYDPQFFLPDSQVGKLGAWPTAQLRTRASSLARITQDEADALAKMLENVNRQLGCDGVIAPAVMWAAGRTDIVDLNVKLAATAKRAGDVLGVPTIATVFLDRSAVAADRTVIDVLSSATSIQADAWYFGFEFDAGRLPVSAEEVFRFCLAGLKLAASGKPVLHGYAGPLAVLSLAVGATGVGISHSQNMWGFSPSRWKEPTGGGGGGDAPPRFFSRALWGTIVYPDEFSRISATLLQSIVQRSSFSTGVSVSPPYPKWERWQANKHLIYEVCSATDQLAAKTIVERRRDVIALLDQAVKLHKQIAQSRVALVDGTSLYQAPWKKALERTIVECADDYDTIELLEGP